MSDHPAWDAYIRAIQLLHQQADSPAVRAVALVAGTSHSSVHDIVTGRRLPSWAIVAQVVRALGGEPLDVHPLWRAAHQELHPIKSTPPRPDKMRPIDWEIIQQLGEIRATLDRLVELNRPPFS